MIFDGGKVRMAIRVTAGVTAMLLAITLTACKSAPNLTGKWAATGKTLENGEQNKGILDLSQRGLPLALLALSRQLPRQTSNYFVPRDFLEH